MISQIRNSLFIKILWGLMGLYLLNTVVDTSDPNPKYIPEDLSLNDQESIIEVVVEKLLGYENAIPEYDDYDTEDHNKKNNRKIDLIVHLTFDFNTHQWTSDSRKQRFPDFESCLTSTFQQLDTPPPKI